MLYPWEKDPVKALQADFAFAIGHTAILVRSSNPELRMVINTERGQKLPIGEGIFTDGTTIELQDIGMPQPSVPTMTVQELIQVVMDKARELGLELA
jgi:hypothetical protein